MKAVFESSLPDLKLLSKGKVREIYELDNDSLLFVASDRISAFDVVMGEPVAGKGIILNSIANFWFERTSSIIENHLLSSNFAEYPSKLQKYKDQLEGRSIIVKKAKTLPIEFIVRGYVAGSGWKEYSKNGTICGIKIKDGLNEFESLESPILTPSTKAEEGHDVNISPSEMESLIGKEKAQYLSEKAIELYNYGSKVLASKGIILADTKFEFGELADGSLILIDEVMTPDSSRFWNADSYQAGREPDNFDKQTLRNWLETQDWSKTPPAPKLPMSIITQLQEQYKLIYDKLLS